MRSILVINAGSSSLKFQIFAIEGEALARRVRGKLDGIGVRPRLRAAGPDGRELVARDYPPAAVPDLPAAIAETRAWLADLEGLDLVAIGHRVVHGGADHVRPVLLDAAVLDSLAALQQLAPLHQPHNLAPIRQAMEISPEVPQVACFDTAFHRNHPAMADTYALPRSFHDRGVRRYGFHGLSYQFVAERLRSVAPEVARGRVIVAHLGSGASMCALADGRSVDSTMGFTALDGLPMATRPGQLDPGVVLHLISEGMSLGDVSHLLYHGAGLKGLSGVSGDMRELLDSAAPDAAFAVDYFIHRCALGAGMLAAALEGLDGFVFTAGIGENAPVIRSRIVERLGWLGAELDPAANAAGSTRISTAASRIAVFVIPTDEELMIARDTLALLRSRDTDLPD